jgi:hypothetical protein
VDTSGLLDTWFSGDRFPSLPGCVRDALFFAGHVAIPATECFRAPLRCGPADGYDPLSPSRADDP